MNVRRLVMLALAAAFVCTAATAATRPPRARPAPKLGGPRPSATAQQPQGEPDQPPPDTSAVDTTRRVAHPSFAGRWKLSFERSVFGSIPGGRPTRRTDVIEQDGSRVRQTLYLLLGAKPDTTVYVYTIDGQPRHNSVGGQDITSIARWDGARLHIVSTTKLMMVMPMTLDERWQLSPDRRTLTYLRHVEYGIGKGDQRLVFDRE